jgi:hypothetical protein
MRDDFAAIMPSVTPLRKPIRLGGVHPDFASLFASKKLYH